MPTFVNTLEYLLLNLFLMGGALKYFVLLLCFIEVSYTYILCTSHVLKCTAAWLLQATAPCVQDQKWTSLGTFVPSPSPGPYPLSHARVTRWLLSWPLTCSIFLLDSATRRYWVAFRGGRKSHIFCATLCISERKVHCPYQFSRGVCEPRRGFFGNSFSQAIAQDRFCHPCHLA